MIYTPSQGTNIEKYFDENTSKLEGRVWWRKKLFSKCFLSHKSRLLLILKEKWTDLIGQKRISECLFPRRYSFLQSEQNTCLFEKIIFIPSIYIEKMKKLDKSKKIEFSCLFVLGSDCQFISSSIPGALLRQYFLLYMRKN